ncbi:uncharacterized protein BO66DRAFT_467894 [Aspergillus aculeatinus CBS 121060]|uniref:Uncharacterized protein n=1 Tax=Aspergillus aculeatinus CBS 121060 TaxID=1448322 RepID=A0ACD1HLY5_9EURO|nr:hypothetical protein BO66DRAFT_467894 [Aspergillus aculeatinus CBS 121060]RAH74624.1 hypothetical protein BO66DRAFT_467894 [Aspergillus aculeatinus CBS 121060]
MDFRIDALATANDWVQGSPTRPYTGIVSLYMADQLSAETAAREIVSVINEMYYGGDCGLVEEGLIDLWRTIAHTSKTLERSICIRQPFRTEQEPSIDGDSPTTPTATQPATQPDRSYYPPTPAQRKLLTLLKAIRTFPTTDPMPGTMAGTSHQHHPSLSPYLGATVFSSSSSYYGSSLSSNHSDWGGMLADDAETRIKCKRGICWAALPFFREVIAEIFQEDAPGDWFRQPSQSRHSAPAPAPASTESRSITPLSTAKWPEAPTGAEPSSHFYSTHNPIPDQLKVPPPKVGFEYSESEAWLNLTSFLAFMSKESILDTLDDVGLVMMGSVLGSEGMALSAPASGIGSHSHAQGGDYPLYPQSQPESFTGCIVTKPCLDLYISAAAIWAVITGDDIWNRRGEAAGNEFVVGLSLDDDDRDGDSTMLRRTASMSLRSNSTTGATSTMSGGPSGLAPTTPASKEARAIRRAKADERTPRGDGKDAISRRTWDAWIGRLRAASCYEDLAASTRSIAAEAADVMLRACTSLDT